MCLTVKKERAHIPRHNAPEIYLFRRMGLLMAVHKNRPLVRSKTLLVLRHRGAEVSTSILPQHLWQPPPPPASSSGSANQHTCLAFMPSTHTLPPGKFCGTTLHPGCPVCCKQQEVVFAVLLWTIFASGTPLLVCFLGSVAPMQWRLCGHVSFPLLNFLRLPCNGVPWDYHAQSTNTTHFDFHARCS